MQTCHLVGFSSLEHTGGIGLGHLGHPGIYESPQIQMAQSYVHFLQVNISPGIRSLALHIIFTRFNSLPCVRRSRRCHAPGVATPGFDATLHKMAQTIICGQKETL